MKITENNEKKTPRGDQNRNRNQKMCSVQAVIFRHFEQTKSDVCQNHGNNVTSESRSRFVIAYFATVRSVRIALCSLRFLTDFTSFLQLLWQENAIIFIVSLADCTEKVVQQEVGLWGLFSRYR